MNRFQTEILVQGQPALAEALVLTAPISFWGGVNPKTGRIADVRHPQHGIAITGSVPTGNHRVIIGGSRASGTRFCRSRTRRHHPA
jgi:predicted aconitase with swiveling domain